MNVCVCVCTCVRDKEREREREGEQKINFFLSQFALSSKKSNLKARIKFLIRICFAEYLHEKN